MEGNLIILFNMAYIHALTL